MSKFDSAKHLREGDRVVVIAGNDRGKSGAVLARMGDRIFVQGINVRKKTVRRSQDAPQGGMMERELSIHASNVALCDASERPIKVKVRVGEDGTRELYYTDKASGEQQLYRAIKKPKE